MPSRGFTLIELLVVIAIIGLLSSVLLSALTAARLRAADAAVRTEASQLRTLMEQERTESGNYVNIKSGPGAPGWRGVGSSFCSATNFGGQYASQAAAVCTKLLQAAITGSSASVGCTTSCVYFQQAGTPNSADKYSIMAYLPYASSVAGTSQFLCIGSSGNQSVVTSGSWGTDGCYQNP